MIYIIHYKVGFNGHNIEDIIMVNAHDVHHAIEIAKNRLNNRYYQNEYLIFSLPEPKYNETSED
jgi:hypothetical protein